MTTPETPGPARRLAAVLVPGYYLPIREAARKAGIPLHTAVLVSKSSPLIVRRVEPFKHRLYVTARKMDTDSETRTCHRP